jgi:ATP synthase I chain
MMKNTSDARPENMPEGTPGQLPDPNSPAERFYGAAIGRISRGTLVTGTVGTLACAAVYGFHPGLAFLIGAGLAYWNFRSLVAAVNALGERIVAGHSREKGAAIVTRFISRILLVGLAGYAIFLSWPGSLAGFLVGLCMPVPALMIEAGYEGFTALRRGL